MPFQPATGKTSAKMAKGHLSKGVRPNKFVRLLKVAPKFKGSLKKGQKLA